MASTTEYSRKILNSPAHAEPCLVYSAKQILLPDNWYQSFSSPQFTLSHFDLLISQGFFDWEGTRGIPPQYQPSLHSQSTRVSFNVIPRRATSQPRLSTQAVLQHHGLSNSETH
jgi:hypothetical protein